MPPASVWDASWVVRRFLYLFVNPLNFETPLGVRLSALPALVLFVADEPGDPDDLARAEVDRADGLTTAAADVGEHVDDLGLVTLPVNERVFQTTPLRVEPFVAILPPAEADAPESLTPAGLDRPDLIFLQTGATLRRQLD